MITSSWYKYGERVLYDYRRNKDLLHKLYEHLEELRCHGDVSVQEYSYPGMKRTGGGDKILNYVAQIDFFERRIGRLNVLVSAVELLRTAIADKAGGEKEFWGKAMSVLEYWYIEGDRTHPELEGLSQRETEGIRHWLVRSVCRNIARQRGGA